MNRLPALFLGVVLQLCASLPSSAQGNDPTTDEAHTPNDEIPFAPVMAPSRLSIGWPAGAMYEGDISVPVHLWSRTSKIEGLGDTAPEFDLPDCLDRRSGPVMGLAPVRRTDVMATGCTFAFIPHFTFRQQRGGSAPVTTPTFNPGFEFNIFMLGLDQHRTEEGLLTTDAESILARFAWLGMGPRPTDVTGTLGALHFRAAHYSNGQAGCFYTNQVYDQNADVCTRVDDSPNILNTEDGSFSTHYIEFGATIAPVIFDATGAERRMMSLGYSVRANPAGFSKIGGMSSELAQAYGRWEFGASSMLRWRAPSAVGTWRRTDRALRLEGSCAYKREAHYNACRGSAEGLLTWPALYGFGVSVRYVAGWDPYNIAFGNTVRNPPSKLPIISIVVDHSRAITISRAARRAEAR